MLLVIAGLRFAMVPWLTWTQNQAENLQIKRQQLFKAKATATQPGGLGQEQYAEMQAQIRRIVPETTVGEFQRTMQQNIVGQLDEYGLSLQSFNWRIVPPQSGHFWSFARATLVVKGGVPQMALLMQALHRQELVWQLSRARISGIDRTPTGYLTLDLPFQTAQNGSSDES